MSATIKKLEEASLPKQFVRFSRSERAEHLLMIISFTTLVLTGLPQKFFGSGVSQAIIMALGGIETTRLIHRAMAIVFCLEGIYHFAAMALLMARGRFVPTMVPGKRDFADAINTFKYCIGLTHIHPKFGRFDFRQKFEYWGVVAGSLIVIATGLMLMFPAQVTTILPGVFVPAAKEMHGGEAILAFSVIVVWHLYGAHLNPLRFPGDPSIFTGKVSREQMLEEHPLEVAEMIGMSPRELLEEEHYSLPAGKNEHRPVEQPVR